MAKFAGCIWLFGALMLVLAGTAYAQGASFTYTPTAPLSGQAITFSSTSGPGTVTWDLDGDDACDDGMGSPVFRAFPASGSYAVTICLNGLGSTQKQTIMVRNRPPTATFTAVPGAPVVREQLVFSSTAADPDGPIVKQEWDLDGDGAFDDATGETALHVFGRAGTHPVALRVTDRDGAQVIGRASIIVSPRPLGALNPAPLVRVVGVPTARGSQLSLISVLAPKGAHVGVRCKGGACPYKHKRFTSKGKRVVLRALSGSYVEGNVIEIRVTRFETMGKITRLRVRAGKRPARLDRCIVPGRPNKPVRCPSG